MFRNDINSPNRARLCRGSGGLGRGAGGDTPPPRSQVHTNFCCYLQYFETPTFKNSRLFNTFSWKSGFGLRGVTLSEGSDPSDHLGDALGAQVSQMLPACLPVASLYCSYYYLVASPPPGAAPKKLCAGAVNSEMLIYWIYPSAATWSHLEPGGIHLVFVSIIG